MIHSDNKIRSPSLAKLESVLKKYDFSYNLKPIHVYSRCFGLVPFKIVPNSNGEIQAQVGKLDILWFVISMSLYFFLAYAYGKIIYDLHDFNDPNQSYILSLGDTILIVLGLIFGGFAGVMDMINRTRIVDFLKHFNFFDKNVSYSKP